MLSEVESFASNIIGLLGGVQAVVVLFAFLCLVALCSYSLLRGLRHIALSRHLFDKANERSVHRGRVPRLGGLMFVPTLIFTVSLLTMFSTSPLENTFLWLESWSLSPSWYCLQAGLLVILAVGFKDDMVGMKYSFKFCGQILAALLLLFLGSSYNILSIIGISSAGDLGGCGAYIQATLDLLIVATIINAFNLIDGIDGLSSGLSIIAFACYGIWFWILGDSSGGILCFLMVAILLAFLRVNLIGSRKHASKMFMGDTGSMTLGFSLAAVALFFSSQVEQEGMMRRLPTMVIFSPLLIPLFDLLWVFMVRVLSRKNPFLADKTHVHHRIMDTGLSQRSTLAILLLLSLIYIFLNVSLRSELALLVLLVDVVLWLVFNGALYMLKKKE